MDDRQPITQQPDNDLPSKNGLRHHPADGNHAKPAQPGALFFCPDQQCQNEGEDSQTKRYYTVGELEEATASQHVRGRNPASVGLWPVGHRKCGESPTAGIIRNVSMPSFLASARASMLISWRVSMCSVTNEIGTISTSFTPAWPSRSIVSVSEGCSHLAGPTRPW